MFQNKEIMNTITIEVDKHSDKWAKLKSFVQSLGLNMFELEPDVRVRAGWANWDEIDETEIEIPEAHKQEVKSRIKKMKEHPESRLTWEEIEYGIRL